MMRKENWLVGQISGGARGSWNWRLNPLYRGNLGYGKIRRPFSAWHVHYQCDRFLPDRSPNAAVDRAPATESELAAFPGCGDSRRLHDILELRVREFRNGSRWRTRDGYAVHDGQRLARLHLRLAGHSSYRTAVVRMEAEC